VPNNFTLTKYGYTPKAVRLGCRSLHQMKILLALTSQVRTGYLISKTDCMELKITEVGWSTLSNKFK
jgi:hypothetical protein